MGAPVALRRRRLLLRLDRTFLDPDVLSDLVGMRLKGDRWSAMANGRVRVHRVSRTAGGRSLPEILCAKAMPTQIRLAIVA